MDSVARELGLCTLAQIAVCGYLQAQQYAALRKPYLINDIHEQNTLLDRRYVYQRLTV